MILHLIGKIEAEMVDKLIEAVNSAKENDNLIIYFTSNGGHLEAAEVILSILKNNKRSIKLLGYGRLCSCAFDIFYLAECEKYLLPGTVGMFHQSTICIDINEGGRPVYSEDIAKKKYMTSYCVSQTNAVCDLLKFNKKELSEIKKGNDVWFSTERMLEFLKITTHE